MSISRPPHLDHPLLPLGKASSRRRLPLSFRAWRAALARISPSAAPASDKPRRLVLLRRGQRFAPRFRPELSEDRLQELNADELDVSAFGQDAVP